MFSKWIRYLLKCFDLCGFYTETNPNGKANLKIFIVHILMSSYFTCATIFFMMEPSASTDSSLDIVNNWIQFMSAVLTYWIIIIESYFRRSYKRRFWIIYGEIRQCRYKFRCRPENPNSKFYFFLLFEYFVCFSIIQLILWNFFISFVGNFIYFNISYIILVKMYQNRLFYCLFYLNLIKYELNSAEAELKFIVTISRNNFEELDLSCLKPIREYYRLMYEMVRCINEVFGWSQVATILFSFYLPLTDLNWAYIRIHERTYAYIISAYCV